MFTFISKKRREVRKRHFFLVSINLAGKHSLSYDFLIHSVTSTFVCNFILINQDKNLVLIGLEIVREEISFFHFKQQVFHMLSK